MVQAAKVGSHLIRSDF